MNEQELLRYQAGRCDAHGNRLISTDFNYLRGFFAAFKNLDGENPYEAACDESRCYHERMQYGRMCSHIDKEVRTFLEHERLDAAFEAFEKGRKAL